MGRLAFLCVFGSAPKTRVAIRQVFLLAAIAANRYDNNFTGELGEESNFSRRTLRDRFREEEATAAGDLLFSPGRRQAAHTYVNYERCVRGKP